MTLIAQHLNALDPASCRTALTRCCGASRWVEAMLQSRPFADDNAVFATAERIWATMERADILEAFSHHPKIGSDMQSLRARFPQTHQWSGQEQSAVQQANESILQALADGNRRYEQRFGYIFIVCATGKTAEEMLALLQHRLPNPPEIELPIAAAEQAKITAIRLRKLLDPPTPNTSNHTQPSASAPHPNTTPDPNAAPHASRVPSPALLQAPSSPQTTHTTGASMRSPITTHALDTHLGKPATQLPIQLYKRDGSGEWKLLASGTTNNDGRIGDLLAPGSLQTGVYQMRFDTGTYFAARQTPTFYPEVLVTFAIHATDEHYHVPLLISPFGFSTYRGS